MKTRTERLKYIAGELDKLCARVAKKSTAKRTAKKAVKPRAKATSRKPPITSAKLVATIRDVDRRGRYGGLVPFKAIRQELGVSHEALRKALESAEDAYIIDLKMSNDPALIKDKAEAFQRGHTWYEHAVIR